MKLYLAAALAASTCLAACATVTRGTKDVWEVTSEPSGARVETSNGHLCEATPCGIKMSRKAEFTATITKPGYKAASVSVSNKIKTAGGTAMAGNVILGGLIGAGVDATTGAMKDLVPNPAHVVLEHEAAAVTAPAPAAQPSPVTMREGDGPPG